MQMKLMQLIGYMPSAALNPEQNLGLMAKQPRYFYQSTRTLKNGKTNN
jgi:hypothetical protein